MRQLREMSGCWKRHARCLPIRPGSRAVRAGSRRGEFYLLLPRCHGRRDRCGRDAWRSIPRCSTGVTAADARGPRKHQPSRVQNRAAARFGNLETHVFMRLDPCRKQSASCCAYVPRHRSSQRIRPVLDGSSQTQIEHNFSRSARITRVANPRNKVRFPAPPLNRGPATGPLFICRQYCSWRARRGERGSAPPQLMPQLAGAHAF